MGSPARCGTATRDRRQRSDPCGHAEHQLRAGQTDRHIGARKVRQRRRLAGGLVEAGLWPGIVTGFGRTLRAIMHGRTGLHARHGLAGRDGEREQPADHEHDVQQRDPAPPRAQEAEDGRPARGRPAPGWARHTCHRGGHREKPSRCACGSLRLSLLERVLSKRSRRERKATRVDRHIPPYGRHSRHDNDALDRRYASCVEG